MVDSFSKLLSVLSTIALVLCVPMQAQDMVVRLNDGSEARFDVHAISEVVFDDSTTLSQSKLPPVESLSLTVSTDKACYAPADTVHYTLKTVPPQRARVRYMYCGRVVEDQPLTGREWEWTPPTTDRRGYLTEVYLGGTERDTLLATIAVDVCSDWRYFPRYGFVATFGTNKSSRIVQNEMEWLARCHINGVQFQDWHYKHHRPWAGTDDGEPLATYKDIANRTVCTRTVENYIEAQHALGMKSIFYNLCYGALDDAAADGVDDSWYLYKDAAHTQRDSHDLPDSWKSDIYLVNPGLTEWQDYLAGRNEEVYSHLAFDGFQIDQLGNRGTLYSAEGRTVNLLTGYASFIRAMKQAHPDKRLVMNAVSSYGTQQIASTGCMDFLYNEVWENEGDYSDLLRIVQTNRKQGGDTLQTVFAAYMDYNCDNTTFNTPGVLLTDAVMFALGTSHLELGGDHMLCREYFPYTGVKMSDALKTAITRYYDFMTAYENLLRDGGTLSTSSKWVPKDASGTCTFGAWPPKVGRVTTLARTLDDCTVIHLLNFRQADSTSWRDIDGTMPAPTLLTDLPLTLACSNEVHRVSVASPDALGGAMYDVPFTQADGQLSFTVPSLLYWTIIVIE